MGIQINGQTDTISASDGGLSVSGYELTGASNINVTGIVTATGLDVTNIKHPSFGSNTFVLDSSGNINIDSGGVYYDASNNRLAIGTTTSTAFATSNPALQVVGNDFSNSTIGLRRSVDGVSGPSVLFACSNGTIATPTIVADDDELAKFRFYGYDGNDFNSYAAEIAVFVDGTPGGDIMPGRLVFSTNSGTAIPTERMRITSDAYVRLASGTGGIQFNGDTAAANALDDYEEGTWTPALQSAGTPTVTTAEGIYTKIGNFVHCTFYMSFTGATLTSSSRISGLPFAYNATEPNIFLSRVGQCYDSSATNGSRTCSAVGHTGSGTTWIYVDLITSGTGLAPRGEFVMRVS